MLNHFARALDIVNHGMATFEGRFAIYEYMAHYGDGIVSHHWENGQNYLYYEALYGGYPLIHNSEFIRDLFDWIATASKGKWATRPTCCWPPPPRT